MALNLGEEIAKAVQSKPVPSYIEKARSLMSQGHTMTHAALVLDIPLSTLSKALKSAKGR